MAHSYIHIAGIAGKFGGGKVWQIDSFQAFGERKVWQIDRSANRLLILSTNLYWGIADDSPNSPNFPAIRYSPKVGIKLYKLAS